MHPRRFHLLGGDWSTDPTVGTSVSRRPSAQGRPRHPTGRRAGPQTAATIVLLAIIGLAPTLAYLGGRIGLGTVSDADHLMLAELLPSLTSGGSLSDWTIPMANYAIPDWPLYAAALALGSSPTATIAWFMTLQAFLFVIAIGAMVRSLDAPSPLTTTLIAVAPTSLFAAAGTRPAAYLGSSYNHLGTYILALVAITLTLRWLRGHHRHMVLVASATVAFAATFSDRIFVFWYLVPAAAAIVALAITRQVPMRNAAAWLATHITASISALPAADLLFPRRSPYALALAPSTSTAGLSSYGSALASTITDAPVLSLVAAGLLVLLLGQLLRGRTLAGGTLPIETSRFLAVFILASVVSVSVAASLLGSGVDAHMRHFMILFFLPLVLGPLITGLRLRTSPRPVEDPTAATIPTPAPAGAATGVGPTVMPRLLTVAAFAPVALIALGLPSTIADLSSDRSPVPVDCIEAAIGGPGRHHGIASYWDARPIEVFSEGRLDVASFAPDLLPDLANADLTEFAIPAYDFAITSTHIRGWELPLERLIAVAGPPRRRQVCGPFTVSDWGPGGLLLYPVDGIGDVFAVSACDLPSQLATPDDTCALAVGEDPPPGFLSYGPYVGLVPGAYELTLHIRSDASSKAVVGDWDVIVDGATGHPLDAGPITGTDGRWKRLAVPVVVPAEGTRSIVELRVDPSVGPIEIAELTIERIS